MLRSSQATASGIEGKELLSVSTALCAEQYLNHRIECVLVDESGTSGGMKGLSVSSTPWRSRVGRLEDQAGLTGEVRDSVSALSTLHGHPSPASRFGRR